MAHLLAKTLLPISLCWSLLFSNAVMSDEQSDLLGAQQFIETTSAQILKTALQASKIADKSNDVYYQDIGNILLPIIEFDYFAKGVMGNFASSRYINSLPPSQAAQAKQNISDFSVVLRQTVIKSYGNIFLQYANSTLSIESANSIGNPNGHKVSVLQKVIDEQQKQYSIQYTTHFSEGQWRIQNVIVEGINMGQSYRSQFTSALEKYKNDVTAVIAHWPEIMGTNEH